MNTDQSVNNIAGILLDGRITMPNGPLTSREHQQLAGDLSLLAERAAKVDELEGKLATTQGQLDKAISTIAEHNAEKIVEVK